MLGGVLCLLHKVYNENKRPHDLFEFCSIPHREGQSYKTIQSRKIDKDFRILLMRSF
jgi:hypothetical protein